LRAFLFGVLFAAAFAALTIYIESRHNCNMSASQLPVFPYILLIVMALLINPFCRLIRIVRAFSPVEVMIIFMMGMVSAGCSTYGLTDQLVPIAGDLFNSDWNNKQSEWNRYVVPYLNERYFVAEPGIQAAAVEYKQAITDLQEKKNIYETAGRISDNAKLAAGIESELARLSVSDATKVKGLKVSRENIRRLQAAALQEWQVLRAAQRHLPDWPEALRLLPDEIDQGEDLVEETEKKLLALEEPAFKKVAAFRRGLSRNERAFPGILPLAGDDRRAYFGRLRRLVSGMDALRQMKQARNAAGALPSEKIVGPELAASYCAYFTRANKVLSALNRGSELERIQERLRRQEQEFAANRMEQSARLKAVGVEKRNADRQRSFELNDESDKIIREMKRIDGHYKSFKDSMELYHREMDCAHNIQTLVAGIDGLQKRLSAGDMRGGELAAHITGLLPMFASIDVSLRRYFVGQVPWECWLKPLSRWALLIGLTYIVLMSLNVLIFRQWAHNERLTYPLAELSKALIGAVDSSGLPSVFHNSLFWAGAAVSMSILGWNLFCSTQIIPGLVPFRFQENYLWQYVDKTPFEALRCVKTDVFFTMIGLSFLVPKNISFSLWFFYLVYMVQLFILVTTGYGVDGQSFPMDWWYLTNFCNAQGQGAMIIFSGVVLYKCRKYILCAFFPSSVAELETEERNELRLSSVVFLGCSLGLILLLWLSMGANLFYAILFYVVALVITIGLVRAVAEGGILGFQANANMFHYVRNFFGFDRSWTSASLFAPLMVYYSIMFMDIKTFIAPAMANALKLREDYRLKRFSFHVVVALAIIAASVVAIATALMMSYAGGADAMNSWFYTGLPRSQTFEIIRSAIKNAPMAAADNIGWTIGGGLTMAALLFFRQYCFWLPHPIGLIMLVNPIMGAYWVSIFLGWLCNLAVTKYGNKDSFQRGKGFFIGIIAGELVMVILSFFVTLIFGTISGIDLNRN